MKGDYRMVNMTIHNVAKHSLLYGYVLSQPFATYVDAYPALENKVLSDVEQLAYGEHGASVRVLQKKLSKINLYENEIDGFYGIMTENAVKNFQKQYQLNKHGITDSVTVEQLLAIEKERYLAKIEEFSESIEPGMQNKDVEIVQTALTYFGYYEGNIDGIYGPLTKQALQQAEIKHDLELVHEVTVDSLQTMYEEVEEQQVAASVNDKTNEATEETASESSSPPPITVETTATNHGDVVQVAQDYIGTPYVWGGTSPSGFDCSGFIQFVFAEKNKTIPRTVNEIWNFSTPVDQPSVGDLVFFETYKAGPSHAGIYVGDGKFIHAGESRGVEISNLDQDYWKQRYLGAQRIQ